MTLTATSRSCFAREYVLSRSGNPVGRFSGRWFSQSIDIDLVGGRRWTFRHPGLFSRYHVLVDENEEPVGDANAAGWFTSTWNLNLSDGAARMESNGIFNTGFTVRRGSNPLAVVDRTAVCSNNWGVERSEGLSTEDALVVGMTYHAILQRRRSQSNTAAT